jgi:O-antigen ligase
MATGPQSGALGGRGIADASRVVAVVGLAGLVSGWLVAHGHAPLLLTALGLVVAAPFLASRAENGLLVGVALVLLLPSSVAIATPQAGVVRVAVLVSFAGLLVFLVHERPMSPSLTLVDLAVAAFLFMGCLSWGVRPHVPNSMQAAVATLLPIGFYVAGRLFGGLAWPRLATVVLVAATAGSCTVLYEFFVAHRPLFANQSSYFWNATGNAIFRPGGVFESPPAAAATLAMVIPIGASLLPGARAAVKRAVWACLLISAVALCVTFTRAGVIGLAGGLVLYLALLRPPRIGRLVYAGILVATVIGLFVLPKVARTSWYEQGVVRPGSLSVRESYWSAAWPVIVNSPQHLIVGHGINSLVRDPTGREALADPQIDIAAVPTLSTLSPHSQYVRTLVEEGVVGLVLLLAWLGLSLLLAARGAWRAPPLDRAPLAACAAAVACFLIGAYVSDALRETTPFAIVALASGVGVTLAGSGRRAEGEAGA